MSTREQALGALEEIEASTMNDNYYGLEEQIRIIKEYLEIEQ